MAGLADYINRPSNTDPVQAQLVRNISAYQKNKDILASLGLPDTTEKPKSFIENILTPLSVPGNLIRAGIIESSGLAGGTKLADTSGVDEFLSILKGKLRVGAGDIKALNTQPGEGILPRAIKLGAAFAADVATDPLSYIGAPSIQSRKALVQVLQNDILYNESNQLLNALVKSSPKGEKLIDELADASKLGWASRLQEEAGIGAGKDTALDLVNRFDKTDLAKLQLAEYLGRGFYGGGRKELVNRLASITGSKEVATQIFKDLIPEQIKGGLVLTDLAGNPITDTAGNMLRLTDGDGNYAGATMLNKARLLAGTSMPATFIKKYFSGGAGDVWDAATKSIKQELVGNTAKQIAKKEFNLPPYAEAIHKDRLLDYTIGKKAASDRKIDVNNLQGKGRAIAEAVLMELGRYQEQGPEVAQRFQNAFEDAFHNPTDATRIYNTPEEIAGKAAADSLAKAMSDLNTEARLYGVDVGAHKDFANYRPFMLTDESYKNLKLTDAGYMKYDDYNPELSRKSLIQFFENPEIAAKYGYKIDVTNPNVVALDARSINKIWEKEGDARRAETDPIKIFSKYLDKYSNKIATRKFVDTLVRAGIGLQDNPGLAAKLTGWEQATLLSMATKTFAPMSKIASEQRDKLLNELNNMISPKTFNELKDEVEKLRKEYSDEYARLQSEVTNTNKELLATQSKITNLESDKELGAFLDNVTNQISSLDREKILADKEYRRLKAVVYRLEQKGVTLKGSRDTFTKEIQKEIANLQNQGIPYTGELKNLNDELLKQAQDDIDSLAAQLDAYTSASDAQLSYLQSVRESLNATKGVNVADLQVRFATYEELVKKEMELSRKLSVLRNDRNIAYDKYYSSKRQLAIEGKATVDELVYNYHNSKLAYLKAKDALSSLKKEMKKRKLPQEEIDSIIATEKANIKELKDIADAKKTLINNVLVRSEKVYGGLVSSYSKSVMDLVENLTQEELTAFRYLRNENKLQEIVSTISQSRNSEETMQAFSDLYKTYSAIRKKIPKEVYDNFAVKEKKLYKMMSSNIVNKAVSKKKVSSKYGKQLGAEGMVVSAASPGTRSLFVNMGVKKWLDDIYKTTVNPTSWERYVNDVIDPLLQIWKQTVTVGRGPGFVATNLAGGLWNNYLGDVKTKHMKLSYTVLREFRKVLSEVQKEFPKNPLSQNNQIATERLNKSLGSIKFGDTDLATAFQNFYAAGAFNDTETHFGIQQLSKGGLQTPESAYISSKHFRKDYKEEDIGKIEKGYRQAIDFAATNAIQRGLNDMNQTAEIFLRFGAFLSGLDEYKDVRTAMNKVYMLHFDYNDLTDAEQSVRRIAPFYTWSRNNIPLQMRAIIMQPGKIQRAMYFNEEFQNKFGADGEDAWINQVLPEYMQDAAGFYSIFKFGDNTLGFMNKMPYQDVNKLFGINQNGTPNVNTKQLAQMLGPIGTPLQMIGGVNYLTGQPLSQDVAVGDYYKLLNFIPGVSVRETADGTKINASAALGIRNLLPILGISERAFSAVNSLTGNKLPSYTKDLILSKPSQNSGAANLLNTTGIINILGLSATMGTPQGMAGNIYGKTRQQQAAITKAAKDMNIDTEWIREKLSEGYSPEQIAVLIRSGKAKERKNEKITSKDWRKYRDAISTLNSP